MAKFVVEIRDEAENSPDFSPEYMAFDCESLELAREWAVGIEKEFKDNWEVGIFGIGHHKYSEECELNLCIIPLDLWADSGVEVVKVDGECSYNFIESTYFSKKDADAANQ